MVCKGAAMNQTAYKNGLVIKNNGVDKNYEAKTNRDRKVQQHSSTEKMRKNVPVSQIQH